MKKFLLFLITTLSMINISMYSQVLSFDLNSAVSIPTSKFKDSINTGFGSTFRIGYKISDEITVTGKSGYFYFPGQTKTVEDGTMKSSVSEIPIVFGIKYYPSFLNQVFSDKKMRFYCSAEIGVFLNRYKQTFNLTKFNNKDRTLINTENWPGFSPSIGLQYRFFEGCYIGYDFNFYFFGTAGTPTTWLDGEINFEYDLKF